MHDESEEPVDAAREDSDRRSRGSLGCLIALLVLISSPFLLWKWERHRRSSNWLIRWLPENQRGAIERLRQAGNVVHVFLSHHAKKEQTRLFIQIRGAATNELQEALATLTIIESLSLEGSADAGKWLSDLPEMPTVVSLRLPESGISDKDLRVLERFPQLEALDLSKTKITPAALQHLKHVPKLKSLHLNHTKVSGGLEPISKLGQLRLLNLLNTNLVDGDVRHVCRPTLYQLWVSDTQITSQGFTPMPELFELVANNTLIDDTIMDVLAQSPGLATLHLSGTRVTGNGFEKLAKQWLRSVLLDNTAVDDATCQALSGSPELSDLSVRWTRITSEGIKALAGCPRLIQLNVSASATQPDPQVLNLLQTKEPLPCRVYVDPNDKPVRSE